MSSPIQKRFFIAVWGVLVLLLGILAMLLVMGDQRPDPPESFRLDLGRFQQVDNSQVMFTESQSIPLSAGRWTALAAAPDGTIFLAGEQSLIGYGAEGSARIIRNLPVAPTCMAIDPKGSLFLGMRDHIEHWDLEGNRLATWEYLGEKAYLASLTVDEDNVYAADAGQRRVVRYDQEGRLLGFLGEEDAQREIPGLIVPSGYLDLAFDPQGALWVVNPGRHGLENYRPSGELLSAWYRPSMQLDGFCGCCNPTHIAFLANGRLVTAEKGISRIKLYGPDRQLIGLVAGPDAFGEKPETQMSPDLASPIADLAVDPSGRIWVLDTRQRALRIFEEKMPS